MYIDENNEVDGGYYILSSQGSNRFNIYSRKTFDFIGSFSIFLGNDMVQNTDGVEIANGIMVVQDEGANDETNFKIVSFENVLDGIQECEGGSDDMSSTVFYSSMTPNENEKEFEENGDVNLILLGVLAGLLLIAFGLYIYLQLCNHEKQPKLPANYVELRAN